MALIKCKECKKEISDKADMCPNCGYVYNKSSNKQIKTGYIICIIGSILLICWTLLCIASGILDSYNNTINENNNNITSESADVTINVEINGGTEEENINYPYYITILSLSAIIFVSGILYLKGFIKSTLLKIDGAIILILSGIISVMMLFVNCCQWVLLVAPISCFIGSIIILTGSVKINDEVA